MKRLRFIVTNLIVKMIVFLMRLIGKNATQLPGLIALKMCPDFMSHMKMPKTIIAITGTNGKTTVANMITDSLKELGINYSHNRLGSNTLRGIVSTFINFSKINGEHKYDYSVLEVDERSSIHIYKDVKPTHLVVTNLFRDSYARNAHADFIFDIIDKSVPDTTKLILNADDLISSMLKPNNKRVYFSVDLLDGEEEYRDSKVKDITTCPKCNSKLVPDFIRYNHIGRYHCESCDFKSPNADNKVVHFDKDSGIMTFISDDTEYKVLSKNKNIIDLYNLIASLSLLKELDVDFNKIIENFAKIQVTKSRYSEEIVNNKRVIVMLAKAINPISSSRSFDVIRKQEGSICVVLGNWEMKANLINSENTAWLYDNDFSLLKTDNVKEFITCGKRYKDFENCLLLSGINKEKIKPIKNIDDIATSINYDKVDTIFILVDLDSAGVMQGVKKTIVETIKKRCTNEN